MLTPLPLGHVADVAARGGRAVPAVLATALRRRRHSLAAFDEVVLPLLTAAIVDADRLGLLRDVLRRSSVRGGRVLGSYCDLAAIPFCPELAVLGSCFARLYDELLEQSPRADVATRLTTLFEGGDLEPASDVEALLLALYRTIEERLSRRRTDRVYRALVRLHRYRTHSCGVKKAWLSDIELYKLTIGRGGLGLVALLCIARSGMTRAENALVVELGGARQLIDDYQDRGIDRQRGLTTLATRGRLHLSGIVRLLGQLERRLSAYYGRRRAREFVDELYAGVFLSALGRRRGIRAGSVQPALADRGWSRHPGLPSAALRVLQTASPGEVSPAG